ncbi:MAG: GspH/FimT family pseudopilin [Proteobacteria bacterium]|nr:GspH/FimT family pseudopilin [Pseudomonadota bacterium]
MKRSKHGFTLIELMVTISILAIVMLLAIPDFTSTIKRNTISNMSNDLITSLNYARSEAIKRGVSVSVCATQDANYGACGSSWNLGWLIFVNPTGGSTLTNTATAPLLKIQKITDQNATIAVAPNVGITTYNSSGFPATATANVNFTIKSTGCTGDAGRIISISATGRPSSASTNCP